MNPYNLKHKLKRYSYPWLTPLAYTIICALSILISVHVIKTADFREFDLSKDNVSFFISLFVIYLITLCQSVVDILDLAIRKSKKQYKFTLLYYMCFVIMDMAATLWFTLLFLLNDSIADLWTLFGLTLALVVANTYFSRNSKVFMVKYHNETKVSRLKRK